MAAGGVEGGYIQNGQIQKYCIPEAGVVVAGSRRCTTRWETRIGRDLVFARWQAGRSGWYSVWVPGDGVIEL